MPKLIIARHTSGRMIDIRDAKNGLACDCSCSCCGDRLVARQGEERDWSFAHESGADCAGAIESVLHRAAKQVLEEEKKLFVGSYDPIANLGYEFHHLLRKTIRMYRQELLDIETSDDVYWHFTDGTMASALNASRKVCSTSQFFFSEVVSEVRAEGSSRKPDVTAITHKGNQIFIEFVVTNACDDIKIAELEQLGIPAIQINLSPLAKTEFTLEDVKNVVVNGAEANGLFIKREWLVKPAYIKDADALANQFSKEARTRFKELKAESEARYRKTVEWTVKPETDHTDSLAGGALSSLYFMRTTIYVSQKEDEAILWCDGPGLVGSAIKEVMTELNAGYTEAGNWRVAGANVQVEIIEAFRNKESEIRRKSAEESARLQYQESKASVIKKSPETPKHITQQVDVAEATKAIIAKHSGIVDYRWRRMKINEELVSLGYPQI